MNDSRRKSLHASVRSVGGVGPALYVEYGGFRLHTWAKWFTMPYHRGFKWRFSLVVPHGHMVSRVHIGNG